MNTLPEIQLKILQSSHTYGVEILISLRAFLFDQEFSPWIILEDFSQINKALEYFNKDIKYFKNLNLKNIKKIGLNINYLYNMPKNKRLVLIDFLNDIISNHIDENMIIFDHVRWNPFENDIFYFLLIKQIDYIDRNEFNIYQKRHEELLKINNFNEKKIYSYENCLDLASKYKIKNYWHNIWSDYKKYKIDEKSLIENIVL